MIQFAFLGTVAAASLAFSVLLTGCVPPSTVCESRTREGPEKAALAFTGTWVCHDLGAVPRDLGWGGATSCTLRIRNLNSQEKKVMQIEHVEVPTEVEGPPLRDMWRPGFPEGTEANVTLWLSNSKRQWVPPDTIPGWIGPDGNIWFGPIGSCIQFKPFLRKDGRLVLEHADFTLMFRSIRPANPTPVPRPGEGAQGRGRLRGAQDVRSAVGDAHRGFQADGRARGPVDLQAMLGMHGEPAIGQQLA
jgi:hypothetical protein